MLPQLPFWMMPTDERREYAKKGYQGQKWQSVVLFVPELILLWELRRIQKSSRIVVKTSPSEG
jgi:hypothetical protein